MEKDENFQFKLHPLLLNLLYCKYIFTTDVDAALEIFTMQPAKERNKLIHAYT
jgi:hypothetical protein